MSIIVTSRGVEQEQCDGCGRVQDAIHPSLGIKSYVVHDPNMGSKVTHHYCSHCASNRGADMPTLNLIWDTAIPAGAPSIAPEVTSDITPSETTTPVSPPAETAEALEEIQGTSEPGVA
jgi:hypothetical protein